MNLPEEEMDKVLMVGDRKHDVEGAAVFHIPCLGNAMGFAPEGELEAAGALVWSQLKELTDYILCTDDERKIPEEPGRILKLTESVL